jgi:hypothetical protein
MLYTIFTLQDTTVAFTSISFRHLPLDVARLREVLSLGRLTEFTALLACFDNARDLVTLFVAVSCLQRLDLGNLVGPKVESTPSERMSLPRLRSLKVQFRHMAEMFSPFPCSKRWTLK